MNDLINSLVEIGEQSGNQYLERWEILNAFSGCMECNLSQQGWFVPQDVEGLVRLLGGRERT